MKIYKSKFLGLGLALFLLHSSCTLEDILDSSSGGGGLNEETVVKGLKQALEIGIENASDTVGEVNGYLARKAIALVLPEDVKSALSYVDNFKSAFDNQNQVVKFSLQVFGVSSLLESILNSESELITALNRTAETAAKSSVPIFVDAIVSMSIADGWDILNGDSTAATTYLEGKTFDDLVSTYAPIVDSALETVNAASIWEGFSSNYNELLSLYNQNSFSAIVSEFYDFNPPAMETKLGEYTTTHALDGLFYMVGKEEHKIRTDPLARVTELLEKVFGEL